MKIALAQLEIEAGDVDGNLDRAEEAIATAASWHADLVVLPEAFTVGYFAFDAYTRSSEPLDGPALSRMRVAAVEHDVAVLAGSVIEDLAESAARGHRTPAEEGLANTSVLFDDDGTRRLVYRKHHLFGYGSAEADLLEPGDRTGTADIGDFTVGVTTCYDLRFPELYRTLVDDGATLVCVPSAWPYPRVEHWKLLPRARAVENLYYVAVANGVGTFGDDALLGRSAVYDPWGTTVAGAGDETTVLTADVDPERVERIREDFPALADRRSFDPDT